MTSGCLWLLSTNHRICIITSQGPSSSSVKLPVRLKDSGSALQLDGQMNDKTTDILFINSNIHPLFIDPISAPLLAFASTKSGASRRERERDLRVSLRIDHFASLRIRGQFSHNGECASNTCRTGDAVAVIFFSRRSLQLGWKCASFPPFWFFRAHRSD